MRIVLVEPEIPQNTGSVARLAAATNTGLDLIGPLGFSLEDRYLKRAGLDYWPYVDLTVYESVEDYLAIDHEGPMVALSARVTRSYTSCAYAGNERLFFGKESKGLPKRLLDLAGDNVLTIPIDDERVRSLNLANAVSIVLYEVRRQIGL
jgi:tRNA (cytidine/uridine-2'-O-)-methyltransferase